jgi:hypothetical protein
MLSIASIFFGLLEALESAVKILFKASKDGSHRVGRVLSFFLQSSELGLPHLLTRRRVGLPLVPGGGGGTLACGRGVGGSPNFDEGTYSYTVVLCKYMYFVIGP